MCEHQSEVVLPCASEDRGQRGRDEIMEFIHVQIEVRAILSGHVLSAHRHLIQLGDDEGSKEIRILFADEPLRELRKQDLPAVHDLRKINPVLFLPDHMPDDLRPEERVESRQDRTLRFSREQRKFPFPVVDDLRIANGLKKSRAKRRFDKKTAQVRKRAAFTAFKKSHDCVRENGIHLIAEARREPTEDGHEIGSQQIPLKLRMRGQDVKPDRVRLVRWIEEDNILHALFRDVADDLIDKVIGHIPEERVEDVVLLDPSDEAYPIGFNILSAHSELERNLLASDLVSVFRRLSTSFGDQMNTVLANAIMAFLESSEGGTLSDLRRFLVEPSFRARFLQSVRDPEIVYYWEREFPLLTGKPQGPILTRLDTFLRPKVIRHMVGQKENRIDFAEIMNGRKILLAKLAQGLIGEENSYLLGTLIVSKLNQMAMSRQNMAAQDRAYFYLYVDEFHNF